MGGAMKYFLKKILDHEIFRSMVSRATNSFFENFAKRSGPPSDIFHICSLNGFQWVRDISSLNKKVKQFINNKKL